MANVIWSSTGNLNSFSGKSADEKRITLKDYGYDDDMLQGVADDELDGIADQATYTDNYAQFDDLVRPMIDGQTLEGMIIAVTPDGQGEVLNVEDLAEGEQIINGDNGLQWVGQTVHGTQTYDLFAIPEDAEGQDAFINGCMTDAMEMAIEDGMSIEEVSDYVRDYFDIDSLNSYVDFKRVPEVCTPIVSIGEVEEEPAPTVESLEEELAFAKKHDMSHFTTMMFNEDDQSMRIQFPKLHSVCEKYFNKVGVEDVEHAWSTLNESSWNRILKISEKLVEKKALKESKFDIKVTDKEKEEKGEFSKKHDIKADEGLTEAVFDPTEVDVEIDRGSLELSQADAEALEFKYDISIFLRDEDTIILEGDKEKVDKFIADKEPAVLNYHDPAEKGDYQDIPDSVRALKA